MVEIFKLKAGHLVNTWALIKMNLKSNDCRVTFCINNVKLIYFFCP